MNKLFTLCNWDNTCNVVKFTLFKNYLCLYSLKLNSQGNTNQNDKVTIKQTAMYRLCVY